MPLPAPFCSSALAPCATRRSRGTVQRREPSDHDACHVRSDPDKLKAGLEQLSTNPALKGLEVDARHPNGGWRVLDLARAAEAKRKMTPAQRKEMRKAAQQMAPDSDPADDDGHDEL